MLDRDLLRICYGKPADADKYRLFIKRWGHGHLKRIPMTPMVRKQTVLQLKEETAEKVSELNALLRGWGNYFCLGPVSKAY